jgi:hypothetical protein
MADPTGTVGAPHTGKDNDLMLATRGGAAFTARLRQLGDAAGRLEQTAAKAGIGNNIEVALQQAEAKLADAEVQNQKAQKALAAAQSRAAAIIEQANTEASATVEAALAAGARAQAEADQRCKDAAAYAKRTRDEADAARRAVEAQRAAEERGREVDGKLAKLNASLREIRREWEGRA